MESRPQAPAAAARGLAAAVVILAFGALGFFGVFSDAPPGQPLTLRLGVLAVAQLTGAGLVGLLLVRQWFLAVLTAWGPLLMGGLGLYVKLRHPGEFPRASFLLVSLCGAPLLALAGGWLGRWFVLGRR